MNQTVSTKNTKNEILTAYEALLRETKDLKKVSRQEQKAQITQQDTLRAVSKYTPQQVHTHIATLKQNLHNSLKTITEQIDAEYERFAGLKQAIASLQQKIQEQVTLIKQLTERSTHATSQVQDIAVKAIEGASAKPVYLSAEDNRQAGKAEAA